MISLLPDFKKPMDPILWSGPFDSDEFLFQVKWDGVRIIAEINHGQLILTSKQGKDKTEQYPELQVLAHNLEVQNAILDGEVVVLKGNKPSFPSVMRRDQAAGQNIGYWKRMLPLDYMIFDLLYLNGRDRRNEPLESRQSQLNKLLANGTVYHQVEDFSSGSQLFAAVENMGMEGIVAKRKDSPYSQGKHHKDWLKIKCRRRQMCLIGGFTLRGRLVNSLLLGVFRNGSFTFAGKAGSGLTSAQQEILADLLPRLRVKNSPFANLNSADQGYYYVDPQIGVQVEFLEWTEGMNLRSPVIKDFVELEPAECTID